MRMIELTARHFRNYEEARWSFSNGVNSIVGPNGMGKTNLLEAIYLLMSGRPLRSSRPGDLIQYGASGFFVEAIFEKEGVVQSVAIGFDGERRRITHNRGVVKGSSELLGLIPGVIMVPEDRCLVKGGPQSRRQYIDFLLAQSDPLYVYHLTRYSRALKQRNLLLKQRKSSQADPWEHEMARSGFYLTKKRDECCLGLAVHAGSIFNQLIQGNELSDEFDGGGIREKRAFSLVYEPNFRCEDECYQTNLERRLVQSRERDERSGSSSVGIHRDDIGVYLGGKEVRFYASEGEQQACVAAMKLGEWEVLRERSGEMPLLLIDDFGVHMDAGRRERLLKALPVGAQIFLTSCDEVSTVERFAGCMLVNNSY
jgi:DNA replication and repair protein RecF